MSGARDGPGGPRFGEADPEAQLGAQTGAPVPSRRAHRESGGGGGGGGSGLVGLIVFVLLLNGLSYVFDWGWFFY